MKDNSLWTHSKRFLYLEMLSGLCLMLLGVRLILSDMKTQTLDLYGLILPLLFMGFGLGLLCFAIRYRIRMGKKTGRPDGAGKE